MSTRLRLVVVGGGILGTMHALAGLRRGYEVIHLERDVVPRGASVRNFGLIWVGGRASGAELETALRARMLWENLARECGAFSFRPSGSLTLARTAHESAALEAAAKLPDAHERGFELWSGDEARAKNPAVTEKVLSALFCSKDAIVEPRLVLSALREHLRGMDTYTWIANRHVLEARSHGVRDHTGEWHDGDLVLCCIGASPGGFLAQVLENEPVRRVRLQMLETKPYEGALTSALADGDSLRYYPAYRGETMRALPPQDEVAATWGAQMLLVKRMGGHLTIGDTHTYLEPFAFDVDEEPYRHLLVVATEILGPIPAVERRWSGVYSEVTDPSLLYLRRECEPGVFVITGPGGRGMTMSPAIAEETFS